MALYADCWSFLSILCAATYTANSTTRQNKITPKSKVSTKPILCVLILGDLAFVIRTRENTTQTNQMLPFLLREWPSTIVEITVTVTKFIKFS